MKLNEVGERPPGMIRIVYMDACHETRVYLDGELVGTIHDRMLMDMPRDGLVFDWIAWRAAKLPDGEHRREEEEYDSSDAWRFFEGCGCRKQTARARSWSDHSWCDDCTSRE